MTREQPEHGSISRRTALVGAAALTGVAVLTVATPQPATDVFGALQERWITHLVGTSRQGQGVRAARTRVADRAWDLLGRTTNGSGPQVFDDLVLDPTTNSAHVTETMHRLRAMTIAWATPHTSTHRSERLLTAVLDGLRLMDDQVYRNQAPASAWTNWWDRVVGGPQALADCLVLLNGVLADDAHDTYTRAIARAVPDPTRYDGPDSQTYEATGANLVDLCRTVVVHGLTVKDPGRIGDAAAALRLACRFVDEGDGLHRDGSYLQHSVVPYTGAYGVTWLDGISRIAWLLAGTQWQLERKSVDVVRFAVDNAFAPIIHDGRLMSFVRGREISRERSTEHSAAATVMAAMLRLAQLPQLPRRTVRSWRERCSGWVDRSRPGYDPFQGMDVPTTQALARLLDPGHGLLPEPDSSVVFPDSARAVHRRSGWAFAVSMAAEHVARYELMNGENLRAAHTGAGMTYLYDGDDGQFTDQFWPTVDPTHLPGTTVVQAPPAPDRHAASPVAIDAWAGGAVLDTYLAAAMTISNAASNLTGYASWFCFDDYVLALGTGLTSDAAQAVETTVENRLLHLRSFSSLTVDGETAVGEPGDTRTWKNPGWAHLEGVGGYVFLGDAAVRAEHQQRTGSWADVNAAGSKEAATRTYVSIVIDHGIRPSAASYAYLVLPGATAAETAALAGQRDVWVGAAHPAHHLVSQDGSGITMATFWQPGEVPGLRSDAPCSVVARESDDGLTVAVADLARRAAPIRLLLSGKGRLRSSDTDRSVTVRAVGSDLEVTVRPAAAGGTAVARLRRN